MKKYLGFALFLLIGSAQAAMTMGLYDIYNMSNGARKCDAQMITDPYYTGLYGGNFAQVMFRCKTTALFYTTYTCTITSINEWIAVVNNKGTMNAYDFIKAPTSSLGGQGNFTWDNVLKFPDLAMNPWCLLL